MKKQPPVKEPKAKHKSKQTSVDDLRVILLGTLRAILKAREDAFYKEYRQELFDEIGPPPEDDTLLGMIERIEDGFVVLTDDRFFELLSETPAYLGTKPFLKKIRQWQWVLDNNLYEDEVGKKERETAKQNLKNIGTVLAYEGQGRRAKSSDEALYRKYLQYVQLVESVDASGSNILSALFNRYPEYKKHFNLKGGKGGHWHRSLDEIAIKVMVGESSISERTIRKAMAAHSLAVKKVSK